MVVNDGGDNDMFTEDEHFKTVLDSLEPRAVIKKELDRRRLFVCVSRTMRVPQMKES